MNFLILKIIKWFKLNVEGITDNKSTKDVQLVGDKIDIIDEKITKLLKNVVIFIIGFGAHCIISAILLIVFLVWWYTK